MPLSFKAFDPAIYLLATQIFWYLHIVISSAEYFFSKKAINKIWSPDSSLLLQAHLGRLILATLYISLLPHWALLLSALVISLWINHQFFGSFNGGSDMVQVMVTLGLMIAYAYPMAGLLYIGVHTVLSYWLAGLAKLKSPDWRSGQAIIGFLNHTIYCFKKPLSSKIQASLKVSSFLILAIEVLFIGLILLPTPWFVAILGVLLLFHLGNAWLFGLNRFTFAWLSAWPGLWALHHVL